MRRIALLAVVSLAALSGEARGQGSDQGTLCVLNTQLSFENEVRTAANTNDPTVESTATGHAQVKVRNDGTTLEIKVFILNRAAEGFTAGHIHQGSPTVNGPIVVPLFSIPADSDPVTDEHFVQHETPIVPVPPEPESNFDLADLCDDPGAYYVNYHTTRDPVGATRGQLD